MRTSARAEPSAPADGSEPGGGLHPRDLRTLALAASAWLGALCGLSTGGWARTGLTAAVVLAVVLPWWSSGHGPWAPAHGSPGRADALRMVAGCALVAAALTTAAGLRADAVRSGPVAGLARERAVVHAELVVRSDPAVRQGRYGEFVVADATLLGVEARGRTVTARVPVLVIADEQWREVRLGSVVQVAGRLQPAESGDLAAVLSARGAVSVLSAPSQLLRAADGVRASVRTAAASGPGESRALVPALVTGDDQRLSPGLVADFQTAGLTHLTAVSGTNLTLVLGSLLLVARWCGVRGRLLPLVGLLGVAGFVLMARPEPSVVRAAAMGAVALLGLGAGGRRSGVRALGVAALALLVADPWLAVSAGFALSALATAGILLVAPGFRDALATWMPRWVAEALAVPVAAQLACTPLVAVLSGQVSLVAVAANVVVAPLIAPATVLGLVGGLVHPLLPPVGSALGWLAGCCAEVVIAVANASARLPGAAIDWPAGPVGITVLTLLIALLLGAAAVLRRRAVVLGTVSLLVLVVLRPVPAPGWPPRDWVLVMCDVGQGDALVLATGPAEGVVVDTGPDPSRVDGCLHRLGIDTVPVVLLTHFHADHIDGLSGVLEGRVVGEVAVSPLREPAEGAAEVDSVARAAGVPVRVPAYGEVVRRGRLSWQVVAPRRVISDSPNDGSLVLLVETAGLRLLLTGDVEPQSQAPLLQEDIGPVDVLKVPHHGSRYQDPRLLSGLGARLALVSVGEDNDYGHPAAPTLAELEQAGAVVRRTDEHGDIAVVLDGSDLRVVSRD